MLERAAFVALLASAVSSGPASAAERTVACNNKLPVPFTLCRGTGCTSSQSDNLNVTGVSEGDQITVTVDDAGSDSAATPVTVAIDGKGGTGSPSPGTFEVPPTMTTRYFVQGGDVPTAKFQIQITSDPGSNAARVRYYVSCAPKPICSPSGPTGQFDVIA